MVIAPWWLASSFNRYYAPTTEQIDFPALGRVGVTPYDDEVRRLGDPGTLAEAERRIAASRAAGRRIWFVSEPGARACADARCEATAPRPGQLHGPRRRARRPAARVRHLAVRRARPVRHLRPGRPAARGPHRVPLRAALTPGGDAADPAGGMPQ
jgi:hypothetical protein